MYSCDDEVVKIKTEPLDSGDDALNTPNYFTDFVKDHFAADNLFGDANVNGFPLMEPKEEPPDTNYNALAELSDILPSMSCIIKLEKEENEQNLWRFPSFSKSPMVSIPSLLLSEPPSEKSEPVTDALTEVKQEVVNTEKKELAGDCEKSAKKSSVPKQEHKLICSQCNAQYSSVKEFVKHYRSHKEEEQQVSLFSYFALIKPCIEPN